MASMTGPSEPVKLRDGSVVEDPRLDRLVQFDERSRAFGIVDTLTADQKRTPRSFTWRCPTVLDQGREGACVAFAFSHELLADPVVYPATDGFAMGVYHDAQRIDQWPGGAYPGARPKMSGTSVLAAAKVLSHRGYYPEYRWAFGVDELVLAVGWEGPAVIGVSWHEQMRNPGPDGFLRAQGRVIGGHAVCVLGVSTSTHSFLIHNSWGPGWGVNGRAWISFADMGRLLAAGGECCIPIRRAA